MSAFDDLLRDAQQRPLTGWDLSCDGRIVTTPAPWHFESAVDQRARRSPDLLDMGTGGGEWLSRLPHRPARTVATEGWAPNVGIARERLAPLGIEVVEVEGADDNALQADDEAQPLLPFGDASFHLVVNRHESFAAREVQRILVPGGHFLTQQVASDFNAGFHTLLDLPWSAPPRWQLDTATAQLTRAGLRVVQGEEGAERLRFADIGAFAWYLLQVPYVCPGFRIDACRAALARLHARIAEGEPLEVRQALFWLTALRP